MKKKIKYLILGGSGFIGTNFINFLNSFDNFIIHNFDKLSSVSTNEKYKILKNKKNYFFHKMNVTNQKKLETKIEQIQPDIIINFAAESHVDRSLDDPKFFFLNNSKISISLAEACTKIKKKFKILQISTDEVFGDIINGSVKESAKFEPTSPYSVSKCCSDIILKSYAKLYQYDLTFIYMCNNFGPYQFTEKFIPTVIFKLLRGQRVPIYGNGLNIREWIYVEDACKAIYKLSKMQNKDKIKYFNLGSNRRLSNIEISKLLNKILVNSDYKKNNNPNFFYFVKDRPIHDYRYALNSTKYKKIFGKINQTSLQYGLKKTCDWYFKNESWLKDCNKRYSGKRLGLKNS